MRRHVAIFLVGIGILLSFPQLSDAQWVQTGNLKGSWITYIAVSGTNLFAATRKGGIFLSKDNGANWTAVNSGLPKKTDFQCLAVVGTNLFVGSVKHGVYLSKDNGVSWTAINSGLPKKCSVWRFAVSGTNIFAVAGKKASTVFRLEDNSMSWALANSGLRDIDVMDLAVAGTNLFAGTTTGVFLSKDDGANWTAANSGLLQSALSKAPKAKAAILRLAVIGTNIFAGTYFSGRVFLSADNGTSWTSANSGLPASLDFSLSDLAVSGPNLFLGGYKGVFLSKNNGASWTAINAGLPQENSVYSLAVSRTNLFAGTEEGKVWRLPLSDVSLAQNLSEPILSEQEWAFLRKSKPKAVIIPKEIKAVMEEGLSTRQGRQDIPFKIFKCLFLPAQKIPGIVLLFDRSSLTAVNLSKKVYAFNDFLHAVIFFRAKNADLSYAIETPAPTQKQEQQKPPLSASVHKAHLNVFIEFWQMDETGTYKLVREVFVPATFEENSATYNPDRENWYSVGSALRPGKYTMVMAITRNTIPSTKKSVVNDLKKVGVGYFDIDLPGPESYQTALETTPVFFIKKVEQREGPDMFTCLHKSMFTYLKNKVVLNIDNVVSPSEQIEFLYFIFGAKPKGEPGQQAKYDIEIIYEVLKEDGTVALSWQSLYYDSTFVSSSLSLFKKQTVMIQDGKGEKEIEEQIGLTPGKYILVIKVKDNVSGLTVEKKVPFEVK